MNDVEQRLEFLLRQFNVHLVEMEALTPRMNACWHPLTRTIYARHAMLLAALSHPHVPSKQAQRPIDQTACDQRCPF